MPKERDAVLVQTPGTPIKSEAQMKAEAEQQEQNALKAQELLAEAEKLISDRDLEIAAAQEKARQDEAELDELRKFADAQLTEEEAILLAKAAEIKAAKIRAEKKAKIARILDRGVLHDRLKVDVPEGIHYEWVRNNPLDIQAMEMLGFRIDKEYATKRSIHSDGSASNIVGDVVCMITEMDNKELIDEVRAEQTAQFHGRPGIGEKAAAKEEREFAALTKADTQGDIPTFAESKTRLMSRENVAEALKRSDAQLKVQR